MKNEKLKGKELAIARKDKQIASMKSVIRSQVKQQRGQLRQLESILDPVDLISVEDESEPPNKRARTEEDTPKSTLAIQHESIKEVVKVKEENINDYLPWQKAEIKGRLCINFGEFVSATAMTNIAEGVLHGRVRLCCKIEEAEEKVDRISVEVNLAFYDSGTV